MLGCECPQVGRLVPLRGVLVAGRRGSCTSVLHECLDGWGRVGVPSACVRVWGWKGDQCFIFVGGPSWVSGGGELSGVGE